MAAISTMSAKMAIPGLLKIEVFWSKGYDVITYIHDFTNKFLAHDSKYIVYVVMRPKFGNFSISMTFYQFITTSILKGFDQWSWFKFNNLGLALGKILKFYTSKELKLKVRKFWGLIPTFVEVTVEKLTQVFPCEFCKILKNTFFYRTPPVVATEELVRTIFIQT